MKAEKPFVTMFAQKNKCYEKEHTDFWINLRSDSIY